MQIGKPFGGFKVAVTAEVQTYIEAESQNNFRVAQLWQDVLSRAKITILREGTPLKVKPPKPPTFSFIAAGAPEYGYPTIQLICTCFGDTMTVTSAMVWQEDDHSDC